MKSKLLSKRTQYLIIANTVFLICFGLIFQSVQATQVQHYDDGIKQGDKFRVFPGWGDINPPLYMYEGTWRVDVDDEPKGQMGFLRPLDPITLEPDLTKVDMGRTFAHPDTIYTWAATFNGNPEYVKRIMERDHKRTLTNLTDSASSYTRYYSVDIARESGARAFAVKKEGVDTIHVTTTPFPDAKITAPVEVTANTNFNVTINAEEFNPYNNKLTYELFAETTPLTSGSKFVNKLTNFQVPIKLTSTGRRTLKLKISDGVERAKIVSVVVNVKAGTGTTPPPGPKPPTNMPPVALLNVGGSYYWPETVTFQDNSYDSDGEIVFSELSVDGEPSGFSKKFSRVETPETHSATLYVVDDVGDSNQDFKQFTILPTKPTAEFDRGGTLKENRKITLDATPSNLKSPVHVAPIDYSKTVWTITPKTAGVTQSDILIKSSNDLSKRELLVRKAGEYQVTLTVTNIYNETSEPVTKTFIVEPDLPPMAKFTFNAAKAIRDENDGKQATITITDSSTSPDADPIKQRIWSVEFDSNNDGFFGTSTDEPKKIISSDNITSFNYKTSKVGNYRFSLEVVEDFGQPTLPEFIQSQHYKRDNSGILDSNGSVQIYQDITKFNIPEYDKSFEVINVPPIIDFGVRRRNQIDVVLNFGGMDVATQQQLTGTSPEGGTYDHTYYTYDETDKNLLTSYASTLEANLLAKGIDARVIIDNSYYKQADTDGVGIRNIPTYGWVDYGRYVYSHTWTGSSSYSGGGYVMSSGYTVTGCSGKPPGCTTCSEVSHSPPCQYASNEIRTYYADIGTWQSDYRYVVTSYSNQGLNSTETVDTTDFTDAYINQSYRTGAYRMYFRMDKKPWGWMTNTTKVNNVVNNSKNNFVYLWNAATVLNKMNAESIISKGYGFGDFDTYDSQFLYKSVKDVENHIINNFMMDEDQVNTTIILGDQVDYTVKYTDEEMDPELKREWKFTHDPSQVNGRIIDNAPAAPVAQSGLYINSPMQLTEVGTYKVQLRAMDDPVLNKDSRFFNYRKWSDEEVQREYIINVHRRPIADFTFTIDPFTMNLTLNPKVSYDPDHQFNRSDKGIVEYKWESYTVDGNTNLGPPPSTLQVNKDYDVTLQVKDIDGAYGIVTKRISTQGFNIKPVASFETPEIVHTAQNLNIVDRSYDPNGDPLTDYKITVRKQGESTILKTLNAFPNSFSQMGLGAGNYVIGLTVKDIPRVPPQMESDLFEQNIKVLVNNPPISNFKLTPSPLLVDQLNTYQDLSSDPDGHALKNYSWTIEKLNIDNTVLQSWNTGVPPTDWRDYGTGRFRVTQTVFDDPPYPLPSLSGSYSIIVNVVVGPQKPYAIFDYTPKPVFQGDTIRLDPDKSFDKDGTVTGWDWSIKSPSNIVTSSTARYPTISNAVIGTYEVTLHVRDNTGLRSEVPSVQTITVNPKPPNQAPIASFIWNPLKPMLGEQIALNPDGSYDTDGTIVSWKWTVKRLDNNSSQLFTSKYPTFTGQTETYSVTLEVTDDKGAKGTLTQNVTVSIASLKAFVTHTPEWKTKWIEAGYSGDVNIFHAGEKFIIELTSTPAQKVWGSIHFGGNVGLVDIPSTAFTLVSTSPYEYKWRAELWRNDFDSIEEGEYMFEFKSLHPVTSPRVEAYATYFIKIQGSIYERMNFHRNF